METTLYRITFKDGRTFKVFCANKAQKQRLLDTQFRRDGIAVREIASGIHTIKQWEQILTSMKSNQ
jgi:hypothetical protein